MEVVGGFVLGKLLAVRLLEPKVSEFCPMEHAAELKRPSCSQGGAKCRGKYGVLRWIRGQ